jgi:hypothetical protein
MLSKVMEHRQRTSFSAGSTFAGLIALALLPR